MYERWYPEVPGVRRIVRGYLLTEAMICRVQCTDSFVVGQSIYYRRGARLASERYRDSVHEKGRYAEIGWTAPDA